MRSDLTGPVPRTTPIAAIGIIGSFWLVVIAMIVTIGIM